VKLKLGEKVMLALVVLIVIAAFGKAYMQSRSGQPALVRDYYEWTALGMWAPNPFYWQGNETDLHAPFLYAALGRPTGAQIWSRWIMATQYGLGPRSLRAAPGRW